MADRVGGHPDPSRNQPIKRQEANMGHHKVGPYRDLGESEATRKAALKASDLGFNTVTQLGRMVGGKVDPRLGKPKINKAENVTVQGRLLVTHGNDLAKRLKALKDPAGFQLLKGELDVYKAKLAAFETRYGSVKRGKAEGKKGVGGWLYGMKRRALNAMGKTTEKKLAKIKAEIRKAETAYGFTTGAAPAGYAVSTEDLIANAWSVAEQARSTAGSASLEEAQTFRDTIAHLREQQHRFSPEEWQTVELLIQQISIFTPPE